MLLPYFFMVEFRQPQLPVFYRKFYGLVFFTVYVPFYAFANKMWLVSC